MAAEEALANSYLQPIHQASKHQASTQANYFPFQSGSAFKTLV